MQSLVPQVQANTSRLLLFNAPFRSFVSRQIFIGLTPKLKFNNTPKLKNIVVSKKLSTKKTNVPFKSFSNSMQTKKNFSSGISESKDDVKIEIISSKKEEVEKTEDPSIISPKELGNYMSLLSIGAGLGLVAMLKIPILTWLSMSGAALTLGVISSKINSSKWYQSLVVTNPTIKSLADGATFSSSIAIGTNLLFFLPHPLRNFTLAIQASTVAGTLAYGAITHLPTLAKEVPNYKWGDSLSNVRTTWDAIGGFVKPIFATLGTSGNNFFSKVMERKGQGIMFSRFRHAASWMENGFVKSADELPPVAKQALEHLNKRTNEIFTPSGIYEIEKISYRKRKSKTIAVGSIQRMERREATSFIGSIYAKSSQRSVIIHFEAQRPNLALDPLPRHAHITSQYITDSECVFQYRWKRWFTGEYRLKMDESVPLQFTHIWVENITPEAEKQAESNFSKVYGKRVNPTMYRLKFVNQNLMF